MAYLKCALRWCWLLICTGWWCGLADNAKAAEGGIIKFGALQYTFSTVYTVGVKTESTDTISSASSEESEKESFATTSTSADLAGVMFSVEYIFQGRFGVGFSYGTLQKNFSFTLNEETVYVGHEVTATLVEVKSYLFNHEDTGLNPFFEVATGPFSAVSKLALGMEGTASVSVTVSVLSIGIDWVMEGVCFRLKTGQVTGDNVDLTSIDNTIVSYDFSGSSVGIGVLVFF